MIPSRIPPTLAAMSSATRPRIWRTSASRPALMSEASSPPPRSSLSFDSGGVTNTPMAYRPAVMGSHAGQVVTPARNRPSPPSPMTVPVRLRRETRYCSTCRKFTCARLLVAANLLEDGVEGRAVAFEEPAAREVREALQDVRVALPEVDREDRHGLDLRGARLESRFEGVLVLARVHLAIGHQHDRVEQVRL